MYIYYIMKRSNRNLGGLFDSGVFALFGTIINCDADDESIYCNIMKLFNLLLVFLFVIYILIFIYNFLFAPTMIGGRKYKK